MNNNESLSDKQTIFDRIVNTLSMERISINRFHLLPAFLKDLLVNDDATKLYFDGKNYICFPGKGIPRNCQCNFVVFGPKGEIKETFSQLTELSKDSYKWEVTVLDEKYRNMKNKINHNHMMELFYISRFKNLLDNVKLQLITNSKVNMYNYDDNRFLIVFDAQNNPFYEIEFKNNNKAYLITRTGKIKKSFEISDDGVKHLHKVVLVDDEKKYQPRVILNGD